MDTETITDLAESPLLDRHSTLQSAATMTYGNADNQSDPP